MAEVKRIKLAKQLSKKAYDALTAEQIKCFLVTVKYLRLLQLNNPGITLGESLAKYGPVRTDVVMKFTRVDGHIKTRDTMFTNCDLSVLAVEDRTSLFVGLVKYGLEKTFPLRTWSHMTGLIQSQLSVTIQCAKQRLAKEEKCNA